MHIHETSPYPPAQLLCKVCALEDSPPGAPDTWIGCDYCGQWWHAACLGLSTEQAESLENYFCDECRPVAHANRKRAKDVYIWLTTTPAHLLNNKYYHPSAALATGMFMHPSHISPQNSLPPGSIPPGMHHSMSPATAAAFGMNPNNGQNTHFGGYPGYASLPNMQGMHNPSNLQNMANASNMQGMQFPFSNSQNQQMMQQQQLQIQQMKQQMMAQNTGHPVNGANMNNAAPHMQLSPQHTPRMYANNAGFVNPLPGMHPGQGSTSQGLQQGLQQGLPQGLQHSAPPLPQGMYPPSQGMAHPSHYFPMGHMSQPGPMQEMDPRSQQMMYPHQAPPQQSPTALPESSNAPLQNTAPSATTRFSPNQTLENTTTDETASFPEGSGPVKRAKLEETS